MSVLETAKRILPYFDYYTNGGQLDDPKCFMRAVIEFEAAYNVKVDSAMFCEVYDIFNVA